MGKACFLAKFSGMSGKVEKAKHISQAIKSILVRILLNIFKGFKFALKSFFNFLKPFFSLLAKIFISLGKIIFLDIYKLFFRINKLIRHIFPTKKIKLVSIFVNRYIIHLFITLLVFIICFANLLSNETRAENFGEKSPLYAFATGSNREDEYIEETLESTQPKIANYTEEQSAAVSSELAGQTEEDLTQEELDMLISGEGSALIKPEFPSMEASQAPRDKTIEYIVKEGDSLSSIAQSFGLSMQTVLWENNLTSRSLIRPGQKLTILPTNGISYKIAKNDTLGKIAKKYKADKNKIIEFNKLANESDIQVGQFIIIPEGQPYYAPAPVVPKLAALSKIINPTHVEVPAGEKMAWPTTARRISQYFNWRHIGLDIDGDFGDPIWAADDGIVIKSICMKTGYGCHVIIDHGGGKTTLYGHFQKLYVKEGQRVARGDVLGEMGSTGMSTGSHLHFEVRFGGKRYNPLSYIR